MAEALARLTRARLLEESSFCADMSASYATFPDLRAIAPIEIDTPLGLLKDDSLRQRQWQDRLDIQGPRGRAKVAIKTYLTPSGVALDNAASAPGTPRTANGRLLKKVWLDGWVADKGDLAVAGSTTTQINATVGSRFSAGRAVAVPTGAGGALEVRELSSVSGANLIPKTATTNAQANGAAIYNCETFYPGAQAVASTLQFVLEQAARKGIYWLLGAQAVGGFTIDLPQNSLPTITFNIESADWKQDAEIGTPISGAAMAAATYTDADPFPFYKSAFYFNTVASTAIQKLDTYEIKLGVQWGFEPIPSVSGTNGIAGWFPTKAEPLATLSFKVRTSDTAPYDDATWRNAWLSRTPMQALIQIGNVAANMFAISLPNLQITNVKPIRNAGTLVGWQIDCKALEDANATDQTTLLRAAPVRFHQF